MSRNFPGAFWKVWERSSSLKRLTYRETLYNAVLELFFAVSRIRVKQYNEEEVICQYILMYVMIAVKSLIY